MTCLWRLAAAVTALLPGGILHAWEVTLPSGAGVAFHDAMWEEDSGALRLRYIVDAVADPAYAAQDQAVFADMEWLCESQALPMIRVNGNPWDAVLITLMAEPLPFGEIAPDVVQFFEAFQIVDNHCIWDEY